MSMETCRAHRIVRLAWIGVCLLIPSTRANVLYVNKNAAGPVHDGATWATAFSTVQEGVDATAAGDEVWVAASMPAATAYVENITLKRNAALYGGFAGTETELSQRDFRLNKTVLDGNQARRVVSVPSSVTQATLDGFTVCNGKTPENGGGVLIAGTAKIANNTIIGNTAALYGGGVYVSGSATITNNIIGNNRAAWGGGMYSVSNVTITTNAIIGNTASNYGSGIFLNSCSATIANNTVCGNKTHGIVLFIYPDDTVAVINNIVAFNGSGVTRGTFEGSLVLRNNDVYGNTGFNYARITDPTGTDGMIRADPLFIFGPVTNVRLQSGSPCIDAGDDSIVTPGQLDLDGRPRIQSAHVDIGAYEFDSTVEPPYSITDLRKALAVHSGVLTATSADLDRLDVVTDTGVDLLDALLIIRAIAGLDS